MRILPCLVVSAALLLALVPGLAGQEVQVPLDEAGEVEEIDRRLAERLGLFLDDYPELEVVRLYEDAAGGYVLEVTIRRDGRSARQRMPLTAADVRALRDRVTTALSRRAPEVVLDQDGRFLLLGTTTLLGLGYYGWAVPAVLDIDSGRGTLAAYMLTAGASFVAPYLYTKSRAVTYGMANAGFWGATRGLGHGAYLAHTIQDNPGFRTTAGLGMAASLAEGLLGYNWARATDMSAGHAHTIGNFGDYGTLLAGELMIVAQPADHQPVFGALLLGGLAGVAAGAGIAPSLPYTWGDAEIQRAGTLLGTAHGLIVFDWFAGDDATDDELRALGGLLMAGSAAGGYLAHRRLEGLDFSAGQGILVDLGTLAGGLVGMGLAVLLGPENMDDSTPVLTLGAIGADVAFLATFASLADDARRRAEDVSRRAEGAGQPGADVGGVQLDVNPSALALLHPAMRAAAEAPGAGLARLGLPLFSLRYRF
ncbi:MAG: hypothetical protein ACOC3J_01345 [Gemmatimonadota bacterium]